MTGDIKSHYEVVVVGAGVSGIYQIKRLADLGVDALVLDTAPDLGGTWYWNRYPGARFDSESYTYGYSFSKELLNEWHWKERFSAQPENLRYLNYVTDKFDLRKYMRFNRKVEAAVFDEARLLWRLRLDDGRELVTRAVLAATGMTYREHTAAGIAACSGAGVYYGTAVPEAYSCRDRCILSRPHAACRGQPMAGGHQGVFWPGR